MRNKGFTLIELLGVIILLGVLLTLIVPAVNNVIRQSQMRSFVNNASHVLTAAEIYISDTDNDYSLPEEGDWDTISIDGLIEDGYLKNARTINEYGQVVVINDGGVIRLFAYVSDENYCVEGVTNDLVEDYVMEDCGGTDYGDYLSGFDGFTVVDGNKLYTYNDSNFGGSDYEQFNGIAPTYNGYIAVGESYSMDGDLQGLGGVGGCDAVIVKYDTGNDITWARKYIGGNCDSFSAVKQTTDDNFVAVGNSYSTDGDLTGLNKGGNDGIIVKYDRNGVITWAKNFGGTEYDEFYDVAIDNYGNYVATGITCSNDGDMAGLNPDECDALIVKYDYNGNLIWRNIFGGSAEEYTHKIVATNDDFYVVVGYTDSTDGDFLGLSYGNDEGDGVIAKFTQNGDLVWVKINGGSEYDSLNAIVVEDDSYVAFGTSNSTDGNYLNKNKGLEDGTMSKYDLDGNLLWTKNYGGKTEDSFESVLKTGNVYMVVGESYSSYSHTYDGTLFQISETGDLLKDAYYDSYEDEEFYDITSYNDIYIIAGYSYADGSNDLFANYRGSGDAVLLRLSIAAQASYGPK